MTLTDRLTQLRHLMRKEKLDYYFISHAEPHNYQYISGFTGSNAEVLIGLEQAYFWTDGRYTEQAILEVDPTLFQAFRFEPFIQNLHGKRIGLDPLFIKASQIKSLGTNNEFIFVRHLIDSIRETPVLLRHHPIFNLDEAYAGESASSKISKVQNFLKAQGSDALVLNDLAQIAWLLNQRGYDIENTPVFFSNVIVTRKKVLLFVDLQAIAKVDLEGLTIEVHPYADFYTALAKLPEQKVLIDERTANQALYLALKDHEVSLIQNPIQLWKACKNETEIKGAKQAHLLDALALIRFFSWLEHHQTGQTEMSIAEKLLEFRRYAKSFHEPSFPTIAGFAAHGAIIHYHATPQTNKAIDNSALLLIDSGGQYSEGTTDVTRTLHLGQPSAFEKQCYTLVLKGHLALKRAIFPQGTRGEQLDVLARQFLWQQGYNYAHGTGHGVGAFLEVHEGPQNISTGPSLAPLLPNMIVSNEPGLYQRDHFGIRIENLMFVQYANLSDANFYTFEDLTLVPYAQKLIDRELLTETELTQINSYHAEIFKQLSPHLEQTPLAWLQDATQVIHK